MNDHAHDRFSDRLSEYLDQSLGARERAVMDEHLQKCPHCASVLEQLGDVVARSKNLPASPPATDLWPAIRAEIEATSSAAQAPQGRPRDIRQHPRFGAWRLTLSMPQAVAAGLTLALLSAGAMWLAMRPQSPGVAPPLTASRPFPAPSTGAAPPPAATGAEPDVAPTQNAAPAPAPSDLRPDPSGAVLAAYSDPRYVATIAELQRVLSEGRGKLDTSTVRILEQNLAIIDKALEDARRALVADPANTYLREHLASTMRRKVDLLRRATVIVGAHG